MKLIRVKAEHNYDVEIGVQYSSAIKQILNGHNKVLILAPASLIKQYKLKESKNLSLLSTPNGESQKNSKFLELIWKKAASAGIERTDAIIGFGGGATTDVAGFAAATWLRGINWYAIPTSLAGMVDAGIGGKTGINSAAGKNLIGSFYSPKKYLSIPTF
jgi:3-dehydroquinate synthase